MFAIECPGIRGSFNNTCPSYEKVPLCVTWDGVNYIESEDCRVESFNEESTTCQCGPQPPTPSPTVANISSSGLTRKYRTLSLADMDAEDMDMDETDYGFLTPQQRYK